MKEIIKLIIKLVLCRLMHFAISMAFAISDEITDHPISDETALLEETVIIVLFQLPIYLVYRIRPIKMYKIIFVCTGWNTSLAVSAVLTCEQG